MAQTRRPAPARDAPAPASAGGAALQHMAGFSAQQITGVSISHSGRVFVDLPRRTVDVPVAVGDVRTA
ncbi:hypothetical protein [Caulobacter sp. S45]|uniref:hypothetical protein n=1 Tax=Caulobacter sp. S45 TaxID=1641861 RepID=UPI0015753CF0|nr:hypothetical protein [Caulobacter sp. S45]